jgi:hypothetical protein
MMIKLTKASRPATTVYDLRPGQVFRFVASDRDGSGIYMRVNDVPNTDPHAHGILYVNLKSGYPYSDTCDNGNKGVIVIDDAVLTGTEPS